MNDPFEAHKVGHLSASSINEYIQNPARWLLHVSGYRDNAGIPAMWRGTAIDKAITKALFEPELSDEQVLEYADSEFKINHSSALDDGAEINDKKLLSEQTALPRYLSVALPHYRSLGTPIASQKKIKIDLYDVGISVPMIGYIDLLYEGVVRDIKTVGRLPSRVPDTTCRQLSIYAKAENSLPIVDYVHCTKSVSQVAVMAVPSQERHWRVALNAAKGMARLLSYSPDIEEVAQLLVPDLDDWRWSAGEKRAAKRLWRLE
jgi:hypothetical protein